MRPQLLLSLCALLLFPSLVHPLPGDAFETCAQSCTDDPKEQARMNAWRLDDSELDKCTAKCAFGKMQLLRPNGDLDMERLSQLVANGQPKIDVSTLKVRNLNAPGFAASMAEFIDKNRQALAKLLKHEEALQP